jgi:hypothetical protein
VSPSLTLQRKGCANEQRDGIQDSWRFVTSLHRNPSEVSRRNDACPEWSRDPRVPLLSHV